MVKSIVIYITIKKSLITIIFLLNCSKVAINIVLLFDSFDFGCIVLIVSHIGDICNDIVSELGGLLDGLVLIRFPSIIVFDIIRRHLLPLVIIRTIDLIPFLHLLIILLAFLLLFHHLLLLNINSGQSKTALFSKPFHLLDSVVVASQIGSKLALAGLIDQAGSTNTIEPTYLCQ